MIASGSGSTRDCRATNWCKTSVSTAECNGCSSTTSSFYKHDLPVLSQFISATPFSAHTSTSSRSHGARNGRRSNEASSISVTIPWSAFPYSFARKWYELCQWSANRRAQDCIFPSCVCITILYEPQEEEVQAQWIPMSLTWECFRREGNCIGRLD